MIKVTIAGMLADQQTNRRILLLRVPPLDRYLPIWIGPGEAAAIAMALRGERFERPLTHDLVVTIIDGLEAKVSRVVVHDLRQNTFFAKIFLERGQQVIGIDARPSDSIAIAVRTGAPIFVGEAVLQQASDNLLQLDEETARRLLNEASAAVENRDAEDGALGDTEPEEPLDGEGER